MKQLTRISGVALSLAYLLLISLWKTMPIQVEWGFCIVLLASLGIPHGAADHLVAEKLSTRNNKSFGLGVFVVKYFTVMLIYGVLWYFSPLASFIIFIGISVFHFGDLETTSPAKSANSGPKYFLQLLRSFVLGIGILGFILTQHAPEVSHILQSFSLGVTIPLNEIPLAFYIICILAGYQKEHASYFLNTGITLFIGTYLPILPAFMCYFAGCHSIYSLRVLSTTLQLTINRLYLKLLPFTLAAYLMGIAYVSLVSQARWLAHSFMFLSILTLPHFFLMHQINPRRS